MKKTWLILALILALLPVISVSSAPEAPKTGGVLRVAMNTNPPSLDPMANTHVATRQVGLHIFESLVTFDENFRIAPQIAEKWDISKDGKVYTFYLRKGLKFHNGDELRAADVKGSMERFMAGAARRQELEIVSKIEVVNNTTIRIYLKSESGAFLAALANPMCQLAIIPEGHVLSSGVNCRCDSPRNMDFRVSSDRLMHVGSSGTCSASVGRLNARAMVLSVGAAA